MKSIIIFLSLCICLSVQAAKPKPTDPKATRETVKLYQNMIKLQQKGLMFGHQDDLPYGKGWFYEEGRSDIKDVCGDYPAVYGWELGHLELGNPLSLDSVRFDKIRDLIRVAYSRGGINTISWHHRNPLTGGTAWDVSSKEVVKSILPGGSKHDLYIQYLDKLADFLLSLKADDGKFIPILFRPYHEHTGSWFWWGKNLCTVEEFKALWRFTVTYLRDTRNLHHLLYAYSSDRFNSREEYLERYPGDDIIDMVAFDLYDRGADYPKVLRNCAEIVSQIAKEKKKISAVSEAGGPIARQTDWWTKTLLEALRPVKLSYVLVWRNPWNRPQEAFGPYKGHPSSEDFIRFYQDPATLFQIDIATLKMYK
jgi:mannan endo-1,4-beta-mannosidase